MAAHVGSAVHTHAVGDGPLKEVSKLLLVAEVVWSDKVDHAPVLSEVVLQRVAREHDTTACAHLLECLGDVCVVILYPVALVTDNEVGAWVTEGLLYVWGKGGRGREGVREGGSEGGEGREGGRGGREGRGWKGGREGGGRGGGMEGGREGWREGERDKQGREGGEEDGGEKTIQVLSGLRLPTYT